MTTSTYLNSIKSGAIEGWHSHQIAPSITGAQAALESGWGTSSLAKPPYNNNFGIKASSDWSGRTVSMPTREWLNGQYVTINASFRAYDSIADSVRDHAAFFTNTDWRKEHYKHVVGEKDYKKSARALQNAGYATDPSYATKLINIIEQYQLFNWDTEAYSGVSTSTGSTTPSINPQPRSKVVGGELSNAGRTYVRNASISVIGDSLGVGTKPYLESLIPSSNYDVVGSRQITHSQANLNATTALRNMLNAGNLKNTVVVIIGTNRGVTQKEVEDFTDIAGTSKKILFVDTASQVNHASEVSRVYKNVASARSNVFYVNWRDYALSLREAWYYADGAGGTYIHMNSTGYRRHAEYIAQAIYEADNSSFSQPGDVAVDTKTYYAHIGNLELGPDGIIEYEATSIDGQKKTFRKDLGVKGFYSPKGDMAIYNPEANEKWNNKQDDEFSANWIEAYFEEPDIGLDVTLLERAVRYLDEHREPSAQYRIQLADIPQTLSIGDTGVFIDHDYNPPLYIEARVLELTTSRTNPNQNTVLIGNVVELQPQAKGWVHTMQQGLQQMREDFYGDWINREPVNVHVEALNTLTLTENESSAYLSVKVMRGNIDVTEYYDNFSWERTTVDEEADETYNQVLSETERTSVLYVTKNDLRNYEATFSVRVYDNAGTMVGSAVVNVTESAEGKSAFEIWKEAENLPNATLADYVEFQRGQKGEPGDKGAPGEPGADGKDGENANSINLLLNGDNGFSTTSYQVAEYTLTEDFISGETYTLIIKGSKKASQRFVLWQNGASTGRGNLTEIGGGMYQITFTSGATTEGYHRKFRIYQPPSATAGQANIEWATLVKGAVGLKKFVKSPEQLQGEIDNKASNSALTGVSNEVGALIESQKRMQENMEAYLRQQEEYNQWLQNVEGDAKKANELAEKVNSAQVDIRTGLNDQAQKWVTQEGFIQFDGETNSISIASESKNTQMIIDDEALGFYSGGTRVAAITNQYLQIDRGIFTKSAQMGNHKFEPLASNPDHFILSYVKGGNQ